MLFSSPEIQFEPAIVDSCDYLGRTVWGVVALVMVDGAEVFRSKPYGKRIGARKEAEAFLVARDMAVQKCAAPLMAKKPQNFDTSSLPLFGDAKNQGELF